MQENKKTITVNGREYTLKAASTLLDHWEQPATEDVQAILRYATGRILLQPDGTPYPTEADALESVIRADADAVLDEVRMTYWDWIPDTTDDESAEEGADKRNPSEA